MQEGDDRLDPTSGRVFIEIQETFQQQMWKGNDGVNPVDPTADGILNEIQETF